jgi:hypothetical protein
LSISVSPEPQTTIRLESRNYANRLPIGLLPPICCQPLTDADKQRLAENFKYEAQLMSNLYRVFKTNPNPKLQQKLESVHQKLGQSPGLDLAHLKLTAKGFEKR